MIIHHLNCGSFCPHIKIFDEISHCHCLLIEDKDQLILLDTGIGKGHKNLVMQAQASVAGVQFDKFLSAKEQVIKLGFKVEDVKHILLTHLDYDHAGGLLDFPNACLHLLKSELEEANKFSSMTRYTKKLWQNHTNIVTYDQYGTIWNGFEAIQDLPGIPPEVLMVPLIGHTKGHTGFAIKTNEGWKFHVGDAYFNNSEMGGAFSGLKFKAFARLNCYNNSQRLSNLKRVKKIKDKKKAVVFSSHDPYDFNKFK